jgi:hypothetical protein
MKKSVLVVVLYVSILNFVLPATSVSATSVGKGCSKAGAIAGTKKNSLVCKKVGKKLVWQRFVTASPSSLIAVSTTTIPISTTTVPSRNICLVGGACQVGDIGPGGGIVFYDAGSLQSWGRYLEASVTDLPRSQWHDAMTAAQAYESGGAADWRLPSIDELRLMFAQRAIIGGFKSSGNDQQYWSATEEGDDKSYVLSMFNGFVKSRLKFFEGYSNSSSRAIRAF